jgi:hypothetical protein
MTVRTSPTHPLPAEGQARACDRPSSMKISDGATRLLGGSERAKHPLPTGEGRSGARISESESLHSSQRSGGVRGQGLPRFTSQCCGENPSPRLFRAEWFGTDSLHSRIARSRADPLPRGEGGAGPLQASGPCLASAPTAHPLSSSEQRASPLHLGKLLNVSAPRERPKDNDQRTATNGQRPTNNGQRTTDNGQRRPC